MDLFRRSGATRVGVAGVVAVVALGLLGVSSATAGTTRTTTRDVVDLAVPAPTGPHPVGTSSLHMVDPSRPDPWNPDVSVRELMVSVHYPASAAVGEKARYMTPRESAEIVTSRGLELPPGVPATIASTTRTYARVAAPPKPRRGGWPLVVLSPGFTMPRSSLTTVAEELASRGYVVATVDHTYETVVEFPDGRLTTCLPCQGDPDQETFRKVITGRAEDVSFVLDVLTGARGGRLTGPGGARWRDSRFIDASRIAMAGHSIGGASTWHTMQTDDRVDAGVNMDGTFFLPTEETMRRPFLLLGAESHETGEDPTWEAAWSRMAGWKRWLQVQQANHGTFTDWPLLLQQLGAPGDGPDAIDPSRGLEVTRAYLTAYVNHHLRGRSEPLLDGPSGDYPEVTFWKQPTRR